MKLTGTSHKRSSPSRWKISCARRCNIDVEIAGRTAAQTAFTIADERSRTSIHAGGNAERDLDFILRPGTAATATGFLDHATRALTVRDRFARYRKCRVT